MAEKEKHVVGLKAKLAVATTPLQKANFKQQIAVLLAGKDVIAVAKIKTEYNAAKAKIFADEALARKKEAEAKAAAIARKEEESGG